MEMRSQKNWEQANKDYLTAHLELLRQSLKRASGACAEEDSHALVMPPGIEHATPAALEILVALFHLSDFERDVLLLCAGVELHSEFTLLCSILQGDASSNFPTFQLAISALSNSHWSALAPDAPLRRWRLIEIEPTRVFTLSPLRIDERIIHYLAGVSYLDSRLTALFQPLPEYETLVLSQQKIAQKILETWTLAVQNGVFPIAVQLCGSEPAMLRNIAGWLALHCDCNLFLLSASMLPTSASELEEVLLLWERETMLTRCLLLLDCSDLDRIDSAHEYAAMRLIEANKGPLLISSRERRMLLHSSLTFDIQKPTADEQRVLWQTALGNQAVALNGLISRLVAHFHLNEPAISAVGAGVQGHVLASEQMPSAQELGEVTWNLCRMQARPRLDDLAERIEPVATWADLIVSDAQRVVLHEIVMHVQQRTQVYETWGFSSKGLHSSGISALFAGASGVGKTMTAEVLAHELHLDLYRIDLSMVISKYIGETEKNLRRIFDIAEESGVILLFDEADALFGKRSEVKDSHDRYANIEVSYLLQRMEAYHGLVILTSNMKDALDQAFLRRIRFIVQFSFPTIEQRVEIWRHIFPAAAPTEGLDMERLAQLNMAGGNIRNIALNAAVIAADAGEPICMEHILRAARHEYAKLEKTLTSAETRGWYETISN